VTKERRSDICRLSDSQSLIREEEETVTMQRRNWAAEISPQTGFAVKVLPEVKNQSSHENIVAKIIIRQDHDTDSSLSG